MKNEKTVKKVLILGAAGRDFHDFNVYFRDNPNYKVIGFTATQIPGIDDKIYPQKLSGKLYPKGIHIFPEQKLEGLIKKYKIDDVIFSYSDVYYPTLMNIASRVLASGANFTLLGPNKTMLKSSKPVIAVCAVRTGCGKSNVTRKIATILKKQGKKVAIIRHPMPYGDLIEQTVQKFENYEDLAKHKCTIEEMEEYEPIINAGFIVWAGVDYEKILRRAEKESDIIIWDGGNNDLPFIKPDLFFTIVDPLRPGDEILYHPGEANLRMADVVIINKENSAKKQDIEQVVKNIKSCNPNAKIIHAISQVSVERPKLIKDKKVLVIEDGPTVTHGGMGFGAGMIAAKKYKAKQIVSPVPFAKASIKKTYEKYPHLEKVLPAMGYSKQQIKDLEQTINAIPCDIVVSGTPIDLSKILKINKPIAQVSYEFLETSALNLTKILKDAKFI
jgi:predicted GTPase